MEEKIYKTMSSTGAANLAIGICVLVGGIVSGILLIVNGARLLNTKEKLCFNGIFPKRRECIPLKGHFLSFFLAISQPILRIPQSHRNVPLSSHHN